MGRDKEEDVKSLPTLPELQAMDGDEDADELSSPLSQTSMYGAPAKEGPCARALRSGFEAKTGAELFDGIYLGKSMGAGVQAKVFELVREDGSSLGKAIKLGHQNLNASIMSQFAGSMMDLQREWALGMQLKAALEEKDGTLPGFTRTCDCLVMVEGGGRLKKASFTGMIMEKLRGWTIEKRIMDPSFHNIHYVREMLFQVFSALDRAQRAVGFNHADLGLGNVMECYPKVFPDIEEDEKNQNAALLASCKNARKAELRPGRSSTWRRSMTGAGCSAPPSIAGFSVDSDGKLAPLGPHIEFKIIDYGVGEFNEVLAQAAGGHEPEETLRKIHDVFSLKGIPIGPNADQSKSSLQRKGSGISEDGIEFMTGEEQAGGQTPSQKWKLWKVGQGNRFQVADMASVQPKKRGKKSAMTVASGNPGAIERMYRNFWSRKGDVFHLLLALALALDDRVWPKEDERDVQLFVSLVHHVTGIKLKASFVSLDDPKRPKVVGQRKKSRSTKQQSNIEEKQVSYNYETLYGARVRCFRAFRRFRLLMAAHIKPFNSGLLAGEALVSPFFGLKGAPHAKLPVCVEAAFPFREHTDAATD